MTALWCTIPSPAPTSPITLTFNTGGAASNFDVYIGEAVGVSTTQAIAASQNNELIRGNTTTTQVAGPVHLYESGNYLLTARTTGGWNSLDRYIIEPAAPFAMTYLFRFSWIALAEFAATASISGSGTASYSATAPLASPSSSMFAWAGAPYTHPTAIQGLGAYANGTSTTYNFDDPETDAGVILVGNTPGIATWTITPSWTSSMTIIDGCVASTFCYAYLPTMPGGTASIFVNAGGQFAMVQKVRSLGTLDAKSGIVSNVGCTGSACGVLGPVNATSTSTLEISEMCSVYYGSLFGNYNVPSGYTGSTLGVMTNPNYSDNVAGTCTEAFSPTPDTYGVSWYTPSAYSTPQSMSGETAIFFTTVVPPATAESVHGGKAVHGGGQVLQ